METLETDRFGTMTGYEEIVMSAEIASKLFLSVAEQGLQSAGDKVYALATCERPDLQINRDGPF